MSAIRKLLLVGFETYIADLYKQGRISLRKAANILNTSQTEAIDIFAKHAVKGNLAPADVLVPLISSLWQSAEIMSYCPG